MRDHLLEDVLARIEQARRASRVLLSVLDLDAEIWWREVAKVRREVDLLRGTAERARPWLGAVVAARLLTLADLLEAAQRELVLGCLLGPHDDGAGVVAVRRAVRGLGPSASRMEYELRLLAGGGGAPETTS